MRLRLFPLFLIVLFRSQAAAQPETAARVTIAVQDPSGGPIKGAHVIIRELSQVQTDVTTALTNDDGEIAPLMLHPGLFRAIASVPHSAFKTQIQEFLVEEKPVHAEITLDVLPTDTPPDVIVHVEARRLKFKVVTWDGRPAGGSRMLSRDRAATPSSEHWYTTNTAGKAVIEANSNPVVVVVIYGSTLVSREFSSKPGHEIVMMLPKP